MEEGALSDKVHALNIQKGNAHSPEDSPELGYTGDNPPQSLSSLSSVNDTNPISNKELEERNARSYFDDTSISMATDAAESTHRKIIPPERVSSRTIETQRQESLSDDNHYEAFETSSSSLDPSRSQSVSGEQVEDPKSNAEKLGLHGHDEKSRIDPTNKRSEDDADAKHGYENNYYNSPGTGFEHEKESDFEKEICSPVSHHSYRAEPSRSEVAHSVSEHSEPKDLEPERSESVHSDFVYSNSESSNLARSEIDSSKHERNEPEFSNRKDSPLKDNLTPARSRFVGSNGSPHGISETEEHSLVAPSLDLEDGSEDDRNVPSIESSSRLKKETRESLSPADSFKSPRITKKSSKRNLDYVSPVHSSSPRDSFYGSSQHLSSHPTRDHSRHSLEFNEEDEDEYDSLFDNANEVLAHGGPSATFSRKRAAQSKRTNKLEGPSAFLSFNGDSIVGFRAKEQERRKLETENLELKMKLQEYREMSASENEIVKMKHELARAENRIDELEHALERKNRMIEEFTADRDQAVDEIHEVESSRQKERERADGLYLEINELQSLISDLEQQDKKLLAKAHNDFPDILPENPDLTDLLNALRSTVEQNETLTRVSSLASSLKAQTGQIQAAMRESGHVGDPAEIIRNYSNDVGSLHARERELLGLLNEAEDNRHDLVSAITRLEETTRDARAQSYAIIQNFFAELFDVLGEDFQEKVEGELKNIVERSQSMSSSKIPPLTELMVHYTRAMADMARSGQFTSTDQRIQELEAQISSLEHLIELKMDKMKADGVLRAQIRDLKRELKRVNELRQNEWNEYRRNLQDS